MMLIDYDEIVLKLFEQIRAKNERDSFNELLSEVAHAGINIKLLLQIVTLWEE